MKIVTREFNSARVQARQEVGFDYVRTRTIHSILYRHFRARFDGDLPLALWNTIFAFAQIVVRIRVEGDLGFTLVTDEASPEDLIDCYRALSQDTSGFLRFADALLAEVEPHATED